MRLPGKDGSKCGAQWATATHADIVDVDCDASRRIQSLEMTVLSNEIIAALHGITLLK
jgi:hypothetical protein